MSRIEEALRRSHGRDSGSIAEAPPVNPEPFRSPWEFDKSVETTLASAMVTNPTPSLAEPAPEEGTVISSFNSQWKERLVVSPQADFFLVEQFRRLAATLHQAQAANTIKTVMISSATPGDGKTLTAINLALILSESYRRRVLLVDADLRRPSIRDTSHMPNVRGLADGLRASSEQKLTVFRLSENLSLLPAGRPDPDPMGSLTSSRMHRILLDASNHYDWVVIDAPPVGTVADASILAQMVDATLLVVRAGKTECGLTQKAIEAIGRERILGVVLNAIERLDSTSYAHYYAPHESGTDGSARV